MVSGSRIHVFVVVCCCFMLLVVGQRTDPSEVKALQAVKKSLSDPLDYLRNWDKGDPCMSNWTGVVCSDGIRSDGYLHVTELQLMTMKLSGTLAPELGQLTHLEILDFMWNELTGLIPKEIGNISSLILLLLNGNKLSGPLPGELGYLSNLDRFQIDENNISGPLPKTFNHLTKVKHLHFNNNSISGQLPAELSELPDLIHVLLDNNNLSGNLPPELSDLPNLRILQLDNNNFNGSEIPASYGNFSRLVKLSLRNCSLRGSLPDFSGTPNLNYLDLSRNNLRGPIPSANLSTAVTTIDLSDNHLNGSIPESFSHLRSLQMLSLQNNLLSGSLLATIWRKNFSNANAMFELDLRNNSVTDIEGELNPPANATLMLDGNPLCKANIPNIRQFCSSDREGTPSTQTKSTMDCPVHACPRDAFYEYVPESPEECFCAVPLMIGYRLKSPSFSYFPPFKSSFEDYVVTSLNLKLYQLLIDSFEWEKGPRLRMYLKLFPMVTKNPSNEFNKSEVQRIRGIFSTWKFPGSDFFGPYELLNFTLVGPYKDFNPSSGGSHVDGGVLAAIIVGIIACAVAVSAIASLLILKRYGKHHGVISRRRSSSKVSLKVDGVKDFTFREMKRATDNFSSSTQIGRGGYGQVYKGILPDMTIVAIKRAEESSMQGEKEFLNEIELLSRLHHRNLVSLVGYCDEEGEQMLVYEFMPNGTLRDWLSGRAKENLNFGMRLRIALGSAKGVLYLHTEADPPVFHRDIKASNILLDPRLNAKVADFGLSRLAPVPEGEGPVPKYVSTVVRGTPGYLDPEYFLTHKLTEKSDVYSLGVVFLELLTGMHPISHGKNIVREVNKAYQSGELFSVIDSRMGPYLSESIERFAALALSCSHDRPEMRPNMYEVLKELEDILRTVTETDSSTFSESVSLLSGKSMSSSSSYNMTREQYEMSEILGSNLSSGDVPSITPR